MNRLDRFVIKMNGSKVYANKESMFSHTGDSLISNEDWHGMFNNQGDFRIDHNGDIEIERNQHLDRLYYSFLSEPIIQPINIIYFPVIGSLP